MKRRITRSIAAALMILMTAFALSACGSSAPAKEAAPQPAAQADEPEEVKEETKEEPKADPSLAGDYEFYCAYLSPEFLAETLEQELAPTEGVGSAYVDFPEMAGETVQLFEDGTGYLQWGEDNNGPIDTWTSEGENLTLHAGVSDMDATVKNGLMTIEMEDGFEVLFLRKGAEDPKLEQITLDQFVAMVFPKEEEPEAEEEIEAAVEEETEAAVEEKTEAAAKEDAGAADGSEAAAEGETAPDESEWNVFGEYTAVAAGVEDRILHDMAGMELTSTLSLYEDGTGFWVFDEDEIDVTQWTLEGDTLTLTLSDGSSGSGVYKDGTYLIDLLGDGTRFLAFAQEGADISGFNIQYEEEE